MISFSHQNREESKIEEEKETRLVDDGVPTASTETERWGRQALKNREWAWTVTNTVKQKINSRLAIYLDRRRPPPPPPLRYEPKGAPRPPPPPPPPPRFRPPNVRVRAQLTPTRVEPTTLKCTHCLFTPVDRPSRYVLSVGFSNGFFGIWSMLEVDKGKTRWVSRHPNLVDRAEFGKRSFDFFARHAGGKIGNMNTIARFSIPRGWLSSASSETEGKARCRREWLMNLRWTRRHWTWTMSTHVDNFRIDLTARRKTEEEISSSCLRTMKEQNQSDQRRRKWWWWNLFSSVCLIYVCFSRRWCLNWNNQRQRPSLSTVYLSDVRPMRFVQISPSLCHAIDFSHWNSFRAPIARRFIPNSSARRGLVEQQWRHPTNQNAPNHGLPALIKDGAGLWTGSFSKDDRHRSEDLWRRARLSRLDRRDSSSVLSRTIVELFEQTSAIAVEEQPVDISHRDRLPLSTSQSTAQTFRTISASERTAWTDCSGRWTADGEESENDIERTISTDLSSTSSRPSIECEDLYLALSSRLTSLSFRPSLRQRRDWIDNDRVNMLAWIVTTRVIRCRPTRICRSSNSNTRISIVFEPCRRSIFSNGCSWLI